MKCMNCGAELTGSAYCEKCGYDVSVQKQALVLSGMYYNQGLEKAQVRDLSGAIDCLRRSLKFCKQNTDARNLLGLVYFETGEVVSALSEWVISKNMQPEDNIAADYIANLQKDANRLGLINQTIKKYNIALENCHNGNEDVAMIQLRKILAQNPKLIKGYHLLSLLYLQKGEYEKARKLLKKALCIDKTNTTTLRFLREVEEQTGRNDRTEGRFRLFGFRSAKAASPEGNTQEEAEAQESSGLIRRMYRTGGIKGTILTLILGMVIGCAALYFLFIPARMQQINQEANDRIARYASDIAVYSAQNQALMEQIRNQQDTVDTANDRIDAANAKATACENLLFAVRALENDMTRTAADWLADVDPDQLSVDARNIYSDLFDTLEDELLEVLVTEGIEAFRAKDFETAIFRLEAAHEIDDTGYDIMNYLAHAYRLNGDTASADEMFEEIIDVYPNSRKALNAERYLSSSDSYDPAADVDAEMEEVETQSQDNYAAAIDADEAD